MKPLTAAALAGLLRPLLQDVNVVSAPALLKERGAPLTESTRDASPTYDSLIRIKVKTGGSWRTLAGAVIAGQPRIVEVKGMDLEAPFHPATLYINNSDKPGFIGALGMLLGDAKINIATFHLGREREGTEAIALIGVDHAPPAPVMEGRE
jgi:D-3-phosphoglycerate dehydrogenase